MNDDPRCVPGCFFNEDFVRDDGKFPQSCTTVCSPFGLDISGGDLTETRMTEILKNLKHLVGQLSVEQTNYTSLKFLANLESIDCYNSGSILMNLNHNMTELGMTSLTNVSCRISLVTNKMLERLNLPKMTLVPSPFITDASPIFDIQFYQSSPQFCITIEEMTNFIAHGYAFIDSTTDGKYCELSNTSNVLQKTCDIEKSTLANLDCGCVNLRGNLKIQKGDESLVQKLETVETIFGYLYITGTNLTNTNFLGKLKNVISLTAHYPTIFLELNPLLAIVSFPSLKQVSKNMYNPFVFNNNSAELLKDPKLCFGIRNQVASQGIWGVKIDDKSCEDIEEAVVKDKSAKGLGSGICEIFLATLLFAKIF